MAKNIQSTSIHVGTELFGKLDCNERVVSLGPRTISREMYSVLLCRSMIAYAAVRTKKLSLHFSKYS